ncbi:MAG: L,D-transpeptidase [Chitinophagaceae bacterium]|nr:L,D-transpeptidase [Chitinophagaceae bacterium]
MKNLLLILMISMLCTISCKQQKKTAVKVIPQRQQPKTITYQFANAKQWLAAHTGADAHLQIAYAVNRTDAANFAKMDSVIIPADLNGDIAYYMHFPFQVNYLEAVQKIIFFSYPTQTFATYENGVLIHTGPTNMGRKKDPTPTGLFYANWKSEKTTSTFNDEWELLWNFNIENKLGVGWHQYELPGYPVSHSCLRLREKDARYLYDWADQWILGDKESIRVKGTPVIVFGSYNFDAPKPWLQLVMNPKAMDIAEAEIEKQTVPFLNNILAEQKKRETAETAKQ